MSYYAPTIKDKADLDQAIRFGRILGVSNITGDPTGDILKYVDERMTAERLTFGIHNHYFKQKFAYESPEDVLNALNGLSNTVGCTLDIGHIVSCGYDTIDAVRKLGPRLKLVHLKDIKASGGEVNVPLGQGLAKIPEVVQELKRAHFTGLVAFEYEKDGDINEDVRQQVAYARNTSLTQLDGVRIAPILFGASQGHPSDPLEWRVSLKCKPISLPIYTIILPDRISRWSCQALQNQFPNELGLFAQGDTG